MKIRLVDMGNGAVGISLGAHVAKALRFAPGDVVQITVESGGLKVIRKQPFTAHPNEVNCSNLWVHTSNWWATVGPGR